MARSYSHLAGTRISRNPISQKHIDFVVNCAESSRIVAAIELDDSSHERPERRERDAFVNRLFWQMGLGLIRVPAQWEYDGDMIAGQLVRAVSSDNYSSPSTTTIIPDLASIRSNVSDNYFSRSAGQLILPGRSAARYGSRAG